MTRNLTTDITKTGVMIALLSLPIQLIGYALLVYYGWRWYITPITHIEISVVHSFALYLLIGSILPRGSQPSWDANATWQSELAKTTQRPFMAIGILWILSWWM